MTHHEPRIAQPRNRADGTRRHTLLRVLAAAPVLAALAGGCAGLLLGAPAGNPIRTAVATLQPPVPNPRPTGDQVCPRSGVGRLAGLLFDWDTATSSRQDQIRRIARAADPAGIETPGLLADLDGYLPSEDAWTVLAGYRTRQTLTRIHSDVPRTWPAITAADHVRLPAGIAAYTIDGIRHRVGTVDDARSAFTDRVSFTMIVTCPPDDSRWRLLRLSRLGEPLP